MYKKSTNELEEILEKTHPSHFTDFARANEDSLVLEGRQFMEYMNGKLKEKGLKKQDILLQADIPQRYGYKLLTQEKVTKQRDVILRICYASYFTVSETQEALKLYHMQELYARDPRDALLMTCFNARPGGIIEVNEILLNNHFEPLRSSGVQE